MEKTGKRGKNLPTVYNNIHKLRGWCIAQSTKKGSCQGICESLIQGWVQSIKRLNNQSEPSPDPFSLFRLPSDIFYYSKHIEVRSAKTEFFRKRFVKNVIENEVQKDVAVEITFLLVHFLLMIRKTHYQFRYDTLAYFLTLKA